MEKAAGIHLRLCRLIVVFVALAVATLGTVMASEKSASADPPNPSISLSEATGPPGTVTLAFGCGFLPNLPIKVYQEGQSALMGTAPTAADANGCVAMTLKVADDAKPGTVILNVRQAERIIATAKFEVQAP